MVHPVLTFLKENNMAPRPLLNEEQERSAVALFNSGLSEQEVGERLGVSRCTIRRVLKRRCHTPTSAERRDSRVGVIREQSLDKGRISLPIGRPRTSYLRPLKKES